MRKILSKFPARKLCIFASWLALAYIAYATLSPITERPIVADPQLEHFAAFALLGVAFGLSYQNRVVLAFVIVIGSSFSLEALQLMTPDRHGRLADALVKSAGGLCGLVIAQLAMLVLRNWISRSKRSVRSGEVAG
ncbi:hypothetical protein XI09_10200 [Bradyrhizobium sp. CCBAU 11386]|nr:hypothetical protein [Bradyrhizobium sp. CCBAU 11386]